MNKLKTWFEKSKILFGSIYVIIFIGNVLWHVPEMFLIGTILIHMCLVFTSFVVFQKDITLLRMPSIIVLIIIILSILGILFSGIIVLPPKFPYVLYLVPVLWVIMDGIKNCRSNQK